MRPSGARKGDPGHRTDGNSSTHDNCETDRKCPRASLLHRSDGSSSRPRCRRSFRFHHRRYCRADRLVRMLLPGGRLLIVLRCLLFGRGLRLAGLSPQINLRSGS